MRSIRIQPLTASLSTLFASAALAQEWTFVNLHQGAFWSASACNGVSGGQQAGWAFGGYGAVPGIWSGSAESWYELIGPNPIYVDNYANGIDAGRVVGSLGYTTYMPYLRRDHACIWYENGQFADIHPSGFDESVATGISGSHVVGYVVVGEYTYRAVMFDGFRVLHPSGATSSGAQGCYADQQVGWAYTAGSYHAGLWTGTAASWVDLNPVGSSSSSAYGVYAGVQVGSCAIGGTIRRACLWHGTAESWVDLAPPGAEHSHAYAAYESMQVGTARFGGVNRASFWHGSADSWVDLSAYLPSEYSGRSEARGISSDGEFIYIVGSASTLSGETHAALWKTPVPACEGDLDSDRTVDLQDLVVLLSHYGTPEGATTGDGDLDSDGDVDLQDLAELLARFGSTCP